MATAAPHLSSSFAAFHRRALHRLLFNLNCCLLEVLKQVWDLSDQDNDSMLSLREFCIALYLMERFREGLPLPSTLPSNVVLDFPATGQPAGSHGNAGWHSAGFQPPQAPSASAARPSARPAGKPPLPVPANTFSDDRMPPKPPKAKVPTLEKHLVDQLSEEEQKALNLKFQEASEANKKVEELEKEIKEAGEKTEFYRAKMQELVPRQQNGIDCGYFVMRYMKEIIEHKQTHINEDYYFDCSVPCYDQEKIDEVRVEPARYIFLLI